MEDSFIFALGTIQKVFIQRAMKVDTMPSSLKERMKLIFDNIPRNKWRYFHKKSIENFIDYLPRIDKEAERNEIEEIISNYLDAIDIDFDEINIELSQDLFHDYLSRLIQRYDLHYSFVPVFGTNVVFVFVTILIAVFYFLHSNIYATAAVGLVVTLYVGRIVFKLTKGKVYGFRY